MANEKFLQDMGSRVSSRRKQLGMTQEQIANEMAVSVQMVSNLELGKKAIRPDNLVKICSILNISSDYLLTGKNSSLELSNISKRISSLTSKQQRIISDLIDVMLEID